MVVTVMKVYLICNGRVVLTYLGIKVADIPGINSLVLVKCVSVVRYGSS